QPRGRGRRRYERSRLVYRLVHVEHEGDEGLARCRNISDGGMKLDLSMPVTPGAEIEVAFSGEHIFVGKVIWARNGQCGVALDHRIDSDALLRESAAETRSKGFPGLRLQKNVIGTLRFDGLTRRVCVQELSQHGLTLTHDGDVYTEIGRASCRERGEVSGVAGTGAKRGGAARR